MNEQQEIIRENKFLKFIKKDIKENLSLIVLIPSIIGGLWQVLELLTIGLPYVRFFSITQLVSDGITVGIVIVTLIMLYRIVKPIKFFKSLFTDELDKIPLWLNLTMSIMLGIAIAIYPNTSIYNEERNTFSSYLGIIIPILLFLGFFIRTIFQLYPKVDPKLKILKFFYSNYKNKTKTYEHIKDVLYVVVDLTIRISFLLLLFIIINIRNMIYKSDNLENINIVNTIVREKYKQFNYAKMIYFNDKYIFYSLKLKDKNKKEKILILKTDDIFYPKIE
ncbi:hypothetical protein [Planobacterium oryzisoli]|uniref:Uncharacterized protein n=1 Tax=Planobacterium oryzisoli TaxID=2771435 RepID=A0A930YU53_9FLAO|nr:hypothetical protein [Planobacterium oryzisoli]MBF5026419.1 hypothetical protein [Planobacterium oryzisoli]